MTTRRLYWVEWKKGVGPWSRVVTVEVLAASAKHAATVAKGKIRSIQVVNTGELVPRVQYTIPGKPKCT